MSPALTLIGHEGSPYSRKMRAVLRYRRIPHVWVMSNGPEYVAPPKVPVDLIPVLVWHGEDGAMQESMVDSTPQIARLEQHSTERSLLPADAVLRVVSALLEDYADEWLTKCMFHYRWGALADIDWAGGQLVRLTNPSSPSAAIAQFGALFAKRQISRLGVVGANDITRPTIEAAYTRVLAVLDGLIASGSFVLGARPCAADFALMGQLSQLCAFDPTPTAIARATAPRVVAWAHRLEDLSGWPVSDNQWLPRAAALERLQPLFTEMARTYVPFMLANARAKAEGAEQLQCTIDGAPWQQKVFPYQAKCVVWLREQAAALPAADRAALLAALAPSGCAALFAD